MDRYRLRTVDGPTVTCDLAGDDMTVGAEASQRRPREHAAEALGAVRNLLTATRRLRLGHLSSMTDRGVPRVRPALAAVRAAHWAVSDRQAALVLVLPIQQGIVSGPQLRAATSMWSGRRRRALVPQLVQDITDGATSLGELDFARMCRVRGLPEPDRQVVRRTPRGRVYLDARWGRSRLVVEIDGSHHGEGLTVISDHLRQNEVALTRDIVLRISLLGLRLAEDAFLDQVERALHLAHAA